MTYSYEPLQVNILDLLQLVIHRLPHFNICKQIDQREGLSDELPLDVSVAIECVWLSSIASLHLSGL